jgi:hypothetical protein
MSYGRRWTAEEDAILLRCRPRQSFNEIARNYLPGRSGAAAMKRHELLAQKGVEVAPRALKKMEYVRPDKVPPKPVERITPELRGSRGLYHAYLRYGLKRGGLPGLSMALVRCRAKAEGISI